MLLKLRDDAMIVKMLKYAVHRRNANASGNEKCAVRLLCDIC
jgi:hypothetical protein